MININKIYFWEQSSFYLETKNHTPLCKCIWLRTSVLLFHRQSKNPAHTDIGEGNFQKSTGSKPMNIQWELAEPLPHYLWNASAKLALG